MLLRDKIWRLWWTCWLLAFKIVTPGSAVIRTVYKYSHSGFILITGIICTLVRFSPVRSFTSRKLYSFSGEILMFLAVVWSSLCFWSSMYGFIPPLIVLVLQESNEALYAQVCWLCCVLYMPLFGLFPYSKRLANLFYSCVRDAWSQVTDSATRRSSVLVMKTRSIFFLANNYSWKYCFPPLFNKKPLYISMQKRDVT